MRPLFGLDRENHRVHAIALLEQVGGVAHFFGPRHLGDVDQAFDAGLDLDERAEIREARDGAGDALARLDSARAPSPTARAGVA